MRHVAALLCLLAFALASPVAAQTQIHRCIGANGNAIFTDQVCAALNATPVTAAPSPTRDAPGEPTGSTPLPTLCSASIDDLRQSVIDAFARRNANRLAGLMLWNGYGRGAVIADIRSLNDLMKQPLLDVQIAGPSVTPAPASVTADLGGMSADPFAAQMPADPPPPPAPAGDVLVLRTAGNAASGGASERRFSIVRRAGCLWLRSSY